MSKSVPRAVGARLRYAGFARRFAAHVLDALLLVPLAMLLEDWPRTLVATALMMLSITVAMHAYVVVCHATFGATVGKLVFGVRVTRRDGSPIGWGQSVLRSSVELAVMVPLLVADAMALLSVEVQAFFAADDFFTRSYLLAQHYPTWHASVMLSMHVWMAAQVLFLVGRRRRRSLHDLIAGTVVVRRPR